MTRQDRERDSLRVGILGDIGCIVCMVGCGLPLLILFLMFLAAVLKGLG